MSKIANDGLTRAGIGCSIAVPMWHHWASKGLADRTNANGRAYATVLRLSVVCLYTECIVAKQCVLEQKLLLTGCRKSYLRNRLVPK